LADRTCSLWRTPRHLRDHVFLGFQSRRAKTIPVEATAMMARAAKNMSGSLMGAKRHQVAVGDRLNSVSPAYPDQPEFDRRAARNRTHRRRKPPTGGSGRLVLAATALRELADSAGTPGPLLRSCSRRSGSARRHGSTGSARRTSSTSCHRSVLMSPWWADTSTPRGADKETPI